MQRVRTSSTPARLLRALVVFLFEILVIEDVTMAVVQITATHVMSAGLGMFLELPSTFKLIARHTSVNNIVVVVEGLLAIACCLHLMSLRSAASMNQLQHTLLNDQLRHVGAPNRATEIKIEGLIRDGLLEDVCGGGDATCCLTLGGSGWWWWWWW